MPKGIYTLLLIIVFFPISGRAAISDSGRGDSTLFRNKIQVTHLDQRTIRGDILAHDSFSLTIRPFSSKAGGKRIIYPIEILSYDQIKSLKILRWGLYVLMIIAGTGLTALTILAAKDGENLLSNLEIVLKGPLFILAGLVGLFSRKKFTINGKKEAFTFFLKRL